MGHTKGTASTDRIRVGADHAIFSRQVEPVTAPDIDEAPNQYLVKGMLKLHEQLGHLARIIDNRSRPVDEYRVQTLVVDSEQLVTVQPQYDQISERIESVFVMGPPNANCTVQLGDRTWYLVIPSTGEIIISPVSLLLSRNDVRQLSVNPVTVGTPAIPASTVAQQNTSANPVQVVIAGGTVTAVTVNGVTVGGGDGTYVVPPYGSIAITYSVVPTSWTWSVVGIPSAGDFTLELMGWADERY